MTEAWSPGWTVRPSAAGDTRVSATYLPDGENGLESKKRWMLDWFGGVMIQVGTDGAQPPTPAYRGKFRCGTLRAGGSSSRGVARLSHTSWPKHRCSSLVDDSLGEARRDPPEPRSVRVWYATGGRSKTTAPRADQRFFRRQGVASTGGSSGPSPSLGARRGMSRSLALALSGRACGTMVTSGRESVPVLRRADAKPAAPLSLDQPKNWTIATTNPLTAACSVGDTQQRALGQG